MTDTGVAQHVHADELSRAFDEIERLAAEVERQSVLLGKAETALERAPILSRYHTVNGFNEDFFFDYNSWKDSARAVLSELQLKKMP